MNRTANIRVECTTEDGEAWHRAVIDVGAMHMEPPLAFRTVGGLLAFVADLLTEEFDPSKRKTEPALDPVKL